MLLLPVHSGSEIRVSQKGGGNPKWLPLSVPLKTIQKGYLPKRLSFRSSWVDEVFVVVHLNGLGFFVIFLACFRSSWVAMIGTTWFPVVF